MPPLSILLSRQSSVYRIRLQLQITKLPRYVAFHFFVKMTFSYALRDKEVTFAIWGLSRLIRAVSSLGIYSGPFCPQPTSVIRSIKSRVFTNFKFDYLQKSVPETRLLKREYPQLRRVFASLSLSSFQRPRLLLLVFSHLFQ